MADIQDFMAAEREADDALRSLEALSASCEDVTDESAVVFATCVAGLAIARAIREASVRHDYLAHALARSGRG